MGTAKMVQSLMRFLKMLARFLLCLFYFNNMKEFEEQQIKLKSAKKMLQMDIEKATARNPDIRKYAEPWLKEVTKVLKGVPALTENVKSNEMFLTSRLNWSQRYRLSNEIEDLKQKIVDVICDNRYDDARFRVNTCWNSSRNLLHSESFKSAFFEVVKAMKVDRDPCVIAVHGERGVGKTTLANLVEKKAPELLKAKAKCLVVSQPTNAEKIQEEVAAFLELEDFPSKIEEQRAKDLRKKLENGQTILIILDDFSKELNLTSIGIVGCKILVTASNEEAFSSLDSPKVIKLDGFQKEEAEKLLQENTRPESTTIQEADQIADKCRAWPVAVRILGRALREKDRDEWSKAYQSLRPDSLLGVSNKVGIVYRSVKLSYDYLKHETKLCFLLCTLFPKDYSIARQVLIRITWGLRIYHDIDSIENVREKVDASIDNLVDAFLLLEDGNAFVQMQNVIREAALWIASEEENLPRIKSLVGLWEEVRPNNNDIQSYTAISHVASNRQQELHDEQFQSDQLQILFLGGDCSRRITNAFLNRLEALEVLHVHKGVLSLDALQNLTNLRALHLEYCKFNGLLSSMGELKNLEILSFRGSDIRELNLNEIGGLENLRLMDLVDCQMLQPIPLNLIRRLSRLEELYLSGLNFQNWWSNQNSADRRNTNPANISSVSSLEIKPFNNQNEADSKYFEATSRALKVTGFSQNTKSKIGDRTVRYFHRDRLFCYQNQVEPNLVQSIKTVKVVSCRTLEAVFQDGSVLRAATEDESAALLSDLTSLELENLYNLRWIWYGRISHASIQNLKTVKIKDCQKLQSLFSVSLAKSLNKLETLEVDSCSKLKHIMSADSTDNVVRDETLQPGLLIPECLPGLTTLRITGCPALEYIFQITTGQILGKLTELDISSCRDIKQVFSVNGDADGKDIELRELKTLELKNLMSFETFCSENSPIKLPSLQHLEVRGCRRLSKAAMSELTRHGKIKKLCLSKVENQWCGEIFEFQGGCFLSHLEDLKIEDLNELTYTWKEPTHIVTLQNLTRLEVVKCNKLRNICSLLIARNLLQLRHLEVQECEQLEGMVARDQDQISSPSPSSSIARLKPVYFPNLTGIVIKDCNNLKSLFPVSVARLPKLTTFRVMGASNLKEIFRQESTEASARSEKDREGEAKVRSGKEVALQFQELEILKLENLPNLVSFVPVDHYCEFPKLKSLVRKNCRSLVTRFYQVDSKSPIIYAETDRTSISQREQNNSRLRRSFTFHEIPNQNGDIDWSPRMKLD